MKITKSLRVLVYLALYSHYLDFCEKNNLAPVNAASFGKVHEIFLK